MPRDPRSVLAEASLAPSKARGQNFLRFPETARRIVSELGLEPADAVVEIGPGLGDLTRELARVARRVIALEIDHGLVRLLATAGLPPHVEVRHADALRTDLGVLARELGPPAVLVGNLPYSIAGRLIGALLGPRRPFRRFGFMFQAEVGARLLARPGSAEYGPLAVYAALFSQARRVLELGPEAFAPRPRVRSAFLVFDPPASDPELSDPARLRRVVRSAFQQRRKTLRRALRGAFDDPLRVLEAAGIDPLRRGETLTPAEFVRLAESG